MLVIRKLKKSFSKMNSIQFNIDLVSYFKKFILRLYQYDIIHLAYFLIQCYGQQILPNLIFCFQILMIF